MMIEDDDADEDLLEDEDELEVYHPRVEQTLLSNVDARRRIERRLELKRLRELSGDPDLEDSFD